MKLSVLGWEFFLSVSKVLIALLESRYLEKWTDFFWIKHSNNNFNLLVIFTSIYKLGFIIKNYKLEPSVGMCCWQWGGGATTHTEKQRSMRWLSIIFRSKLSLRYLSSRATGPCQTSNGLKVWGANWFFWIKHNNNNFNLLLFFWEACFKNAITTNFYWMKNPFHSKHHHCTYVTIIYLKLSVKCPQNLL